MQTTNRFRDLLFDKYIEHYSNLQAINVLEDWSTNNITMPYYEKQYGKLVNGLPTESRLIDIGCGVGFLLHWLSSKNNLIIEGIDISEGMINIARKILPNSVITYKGNALNYLKGKSNQYKGIFALDLLEHIESDDILLELLETIFEALLPGGFFAIKVPNMANLTGSHSRYMDLTHARGFTSQSLRQMFGSVGFENIKVYGTIPIGIKQHLRRMIEDRLHWIVYRICGHGQESIFSRDLYCVGTKTKLIT